MVCNCPHTQTHNADTGTEADSRMYLPWKKETIQKWRVQLQELYQHSFLPSSPDIALDSERLIHTHDSLCPVAGCRVCRLLYSFVNRHGGSVPFFEDYALLCLYCLHAPYTPFSIFMVAADLLEILTRHFLLTQEEENLYLPGKILAVDLQLHFFNNKCFKMVGPHQVLTLNNLQCLKKEMMKSSLTGNSPYQLSFKSTWRTMSPRDQGPPTSNPLLPQAAATTRVETTDAGKLAQGCSYCLDSGRERTPDASALQNELELAFPNTGRSKVSCLHEALLLWHNSELLSPRNLAGHLPQPTSWPRVSDATIKPTPPEDGDVTQGPCLLAASFSLNRRGDTFSVCLLCECLASHGEAKGVLERLRNEIMTRIVNNSSLVDRAAFIIDQRDSLAYCTDETLKAVIKVCTPQEIHKHLFCDPVCLLNQECCSADILFGEPDPEKLRQLKASVATGNHLSRNGLLDCDLLTTLCYIFKTTQATKINKITLIEITKELDSSLQKHGIPATSSIHTSQTYA